MNNNKYELIEDKNIKSTYRIEKIHDDGEIEQAIFLGKFAKVNATKYCHSRNSQNFTSTSISSTQV